jgi:hypothetical protein
MAPDRSPQVFRDTIAIVRLSSLRLQFPPRVFRQLRAVGLQIARRRIDIEIVTAPAPNLRGGATSRRWFRCPACDGLAQSIGVDTASGQTSCPKQTCGAWRSRRRRTSLLLPAHAPDSGQETACTSTWR